MSDRDDEPWTRRIPPRLWIGLGFVGLAFLTRDVVALYIGGAILIFASLQWGRPR